MKYFNFKRYKLSTIFKNINFKRYFFSKFSKSLDILKYYLLSLIKVFDFRRYNLSKIYKFFDIRRYNLSKIYKFFDIRKYKFSKIFKILSIKGIKYFPIYFVSIIILTSLSYLSIPLFYNYDKSKIENIVCADFKFKCSIQGKINYSFIPTPRIKFKNFVIKDLSEKNKILVNIEKGVVKISLSNLFNIEKFDYKKIELYKAEINLNIKKLDKYKNFYAKKFDFKPINLSGGVINFYENTKYITNINNIKLKHKIGKKENKTNLTGEFLNDKLEIKFKNNKNSDEKNSAVISLKLLNQKLFTKINLFNKTSKTDPIKGNILFKQNKTRMTTFFDYHGDKIILDQANLRNPFFEGKFSGIVDLLPFFRFDLNVELNAINFTKVQNLIINLDESEQKNLFNINKKINGKLNLSTNKIYSKYNLIKSFESRLKFFNGDIAIEQLLFNLGKLGAADLTGNIENKGKLVILKFEKNIFIDNKKYFFSKFGVYNKKDISSSLFISGGVDLTNLNMRIYEISEPENKKLNLKDVNYIEGEFNNILFEDGYDSFFDFLKMKEYIKTVLSE